ncbi:MAG: hypothetical protein OXE95_12910 [Chloroflexi bacterium]|nr:hypothetical protein [Chloroflexota bacterium]MCY4248462.1 hypothetical protein [Chloroflexota bacterium]
MPAHIKQTDSRFGHIFDQKINVAVGAQDTEFLYIAPMLVETEIENAQTFALNWAEDLELNAALADFMRIRFPDSCVKADVSPYRSGEMCFWHTAQLAGGFCMLVIAPEITIKVMVIHQSPDGHVGFRTDMAGRSREHWAIMKLNNPGSYSVWSLYGEDYTVAKLGSFDISEGDCS